MHKQFNIQQLYALPYCIYVFCVYLRTNSDLCHLQLKLVAFYNRDEKCLQRGTDWGFKYSGLRLSFKGLIYNVPSTQGREGGLKNHIQARIECIDVSMLLSWLPLEKVSINCG